MGPDAQRRCGGDEAYARVGWVCPSKPGFLFLTFTFFFFFLLLVQVNLQLLSLLNTGIINLNYTWLRIGLIKTFRFLRLLLTLLLAIYQGPVLSLCPRWSLQLLMGVRVLRPAPSR